MNKSYLFLAVNIVFLVTGQIMWKLSFNKQPLILNYDGILRLIKDPLIWGGLVLFGLATLLWFVVLSNLNLSVAYPLQSMSYVIGILAAILIFKENVIPTQWLGLLFILIGVYLVSRTA